MNKPTKLYHYTSFDTFVKIWLTKKLKFAETTNINDICEVSDLASTSHLSFALINAYFYIRNSYKQISLTMDYSDNIKGSMSPMMWGHYGDKRNGVCIEFDFDKLNIPSSCINKPIKYANEINTNFYIPREIRTQRQLSNLMLDNIDRIFFTKHSDWKPENEYRIIDNTLEYLDITDAITSVYVTKYDSLTCNLVEELVSASSIPVYCVRYKQTKMEIDFASQMRKQISYLNGNKNSYLMKMAKRDDEHFEKNKYDLDADLILS